MQIDTLKTLVQIRTQREDTALRALHAATVQLQAAELHQQRCQNCLQAISEQINLQSLVLCKGYSTGAMLIDRIKQHRMHLDWLQDSKVKAIHTVQEAAEKTATARQRAQELKQDYLRIRAKRDAAQGQIVLHHKQGRTLEENRLAATVEELSILVRA